MIDLVNKRHPAPGWVVLSELANSTGGNVRGFADAFALGIWPSHHYEAHLYEFKASRSDVKKELADPSKGDAIGKFADYRWLVVTDAKLIETLVIPEGWGILAPKGGGAGRVLSVVRKAPKQDATPWTRGFVAALVRHIHSKHVTKAEYEQVKTTAEQELRGRIEREVSWEHGRTETAHKELLKAVRDFAEKSGVDILASRWMLGDVGAAVRLVVEAQRNGGIRDEFLRVAEAHERIAASARSAAASLGQVEAQSKGNDDETPIAREGELPREHQDPVAEPAAGSSTPEAG